MEEADSSMKSDSARKRTRRRSHTRKAALRSSFLNMAEARREIATALQLHRSSSASVVKINTPLILSSTSHNQNYYHQLTDSMPMPEPTWSTTAPAVLCAPVPPMEVLQFEWFDNLSSSYSWWMGFLNSLDGKNGTNESMEISEGLSPCLDATNVEKSAPDANDHSPFTDEWLIFPAADELGEQM
ncbi:hypothetical protein CDL12_00911 [Handroanthus impetiginosus]|uniref:Uncharacterized protein n=1 Tax=Handroanthus impetiginosus TaxID=429701 RepID=A0A2G9I994_9LAMI|nr:hypothetical protein CDL12_00911 [Handroanthus impetiginosus]